MSDSIPMFEKRKKDHIRLALDPRNEAVEMNAFDSIQLVHEAIPEGNFEEVDISTVRFGQTVRTPFLVSSMTAGHQDALRLNEVLMEACSTNHWAMGVGSQRRELMESTAIDQWQALRRRYPNLQLFSNIGLAQIIESDMSLLQKLVDAIQADALIVHCNPLQEAIQPEGTPHFKGAWQALEKLTKQLSVPVIVKETGCGFSLNTLMRLQDVGVHVIDVSGLGGTHWGRIEGARHEKNTSDYKVAQLFRNWGNTTVQTLIQAQSLSGSCEIWASGGIRHGIDAAKAIALGASTVGFAKLMLEAAMTGVELLVEQMTTIEKTLKIAMFCTGSFHLEQLKRQSCLNKLI